MAVFSTLSRQIRARRRQSADEAEAGQGLAEYALILALIALVCAAAVGGLGQALAGSGVWHMFG